MIAIRINTSKESGLGHASRQRVLAKKLKKYGFDVLIVLDNEDDFLRKFFNDFEIIFLYKTDNFFTSQARDSLLFLSAIHKKFIKCIIVDDYRLGYKWEKKLWDLGYLLIIFDDLATRKHICNILIDAKWTGKTTNNRYSGKLNRECTKLVGPEYTIINDHKSKRRKKSKKFNVLVSTGGTSNSELNLKIAIKILENFDKGEISISLLRPHSVVTFQNIIKDEDLIFLDRTSDFRETLNNTDLYIGAAGQTLFELLYRGVPCVSFSLTENQNNNTEDFSYLGHYFHFNESNIYNKKIFYTFIAEIIHHKNRISTLYEKNFFAKNPHVNKLTFKYIKNFLNGKKIFKSQNCMTKSSQNGIYKISLVDDSHINSYLKARNSSINMVNMPGKKINRFKHYIWWLNTERKSFFLEKNGVNILYIWHSYHAKYKVLYGGWFVVDPKINFMDVIYALNWQLNLTDLEFLGVPWVAAIKKENKFVNSLNKKFKFIQIEKGRYFHYSKALFPSANSKLFNFYVRRS